MKTTEDIVAALSEETLREAEAAYLRRMRDAHPLDATRAAAAVLVPEVARLIWEAMTSGEAVAAANVVDARAAILAAIAQAVLTIPEPIDMMCTDCGKMVEPLPELAPDTGAPIFRCPNCQGVL